eukprot:CAMPEP_0182906050 /NCGR_PEP_ID=MMETSP0034_2-20130328/33431_1 /TAXON_ID=156128 /ORGANISM="Nephroselmis pyriformis, Strain CCMP717" /LENGTH=148 /DNA_ID=CAMNT_0025041619 /DNA_START=58 /DNA_END=500 /DNA_ORIENTATION=+
MGAIPTKIISSTTQLLELAAPLAPPAPFQAGATARTNYPFFRSSRARPLVSLAAGRHRLYYILAAGFPQPLQHIKVPSSRSSRAHALVQLPAGSPQPLQHVKAPCSRSSIAHVLAPLAAGSPRPLEDVKVPSSRSSRARALVPLAAGF